MLAKRKVGQTGRFFVFLSSGGVQPSCGESRLNGWWGHQRASSAGQSRDGEVSPEQRALQQPEERKGSHVSCLPSSLRCSQYVHSVFLCSKVCCCCRVKFPLLSWPSTCLLCKRYQRQLSLDLPAVLRLQYSILLSSIQP